MEPAIYVTRAGRAYIAKLTTGSTAEITRIMWGDGRLAEFENPWELTDLIHVVAQGTSTHPNAKGASVNFTCEFRNDLNGGLEERHDLTEFAIYALDPDDGEIMLYMGRIDKEPEPMPEYKIVNDQGETVTRPYVIVRRFPVEIDFLAEGVNVVMAFNLDAFITAQNMTEYVTVTILPLIDELIRKRVKAHNTDPTAHQDIRNLIAQMSGRVDLLEGMFVHNITGNAFTVNFIDLDGLDVEGVWNSAAQRMEF